MPESIAIANTRRARAGLSALGSCDYPALRELLAEDVELWTSPSVRSEGIVGRDNALERLERVLSGGSVFAPGSLECRVLDVIAEGDETASHLVMSGQFPDGKPYESIYLVWQRWQDGRMTYQLELFDAAHKNQQREA